MVDRYPRRRNRLRYRGMTTPGRARCSSRSAPRDGRTCSEAIEEGQMVPHSPPGRWLRHAEQRIPSPVSGRRHRCMRGDAGSRPRHPVSRVLSGDEESPVAVGDIVRWFKNATIRAYRDGVMQQGWDPYDRQLWQDKFHDEIVRSDRHLETIRAYIAGNPGRWWERHLAEREETTSATYHRPRRGRPCRRPQSTPGHPDSALVGHVSARGCACRARAVQTFDDLPRPEIGGGRVDGRPQRGDGMRTCDSSVKSVRTGLSTNSDHKPRDQ